MGKKSKDASFRIPKEIGGVKIPKELRRKGEALIDQANSPAGRQAIGGALSTLAMGAATMATAAMAKKAAADAREAAAKPTAEQEKPAQGTQKAPDPQAVADAIGSAAEAVIGRIFAARKG